jgi:hypothetical protein
MALSLNANRDRIEFAANAISANPVKIMVFIK